MYAGSWVRVKKPPPSTTRTAQNLPAVTLIHDDDVAQALGYKAGFVGGLTLVGVTVGAIDASFGHLWYENGIYSVRHKTPVYEGEVRVIWEEALPDPEDERKITFWLEDREGVRSTPGWAAVGKPGKKPIPPWQRHPSQTTEPVADDVVPEMRVGSHRPTFEARVPREEAIKRLNELDNQNWWYRVASPWGDPIISPTEIGLTIYQGLRQHPPGEIRPSRLRTPMDAGMDLVTYQPLFTDRAYRVKSWLCEKWQTERSLFFCYEYSFADDSGNNVAVMRCYSAHLIQDLKPVSSI